MADAPKPTRVKAAPRATTTSKPKASEPAALTAKQALAASELATKPKPVAAAKAVARPRATPMSKAPAVPAPAIVSEPVVAAEPVAVADTAVPEVVAAPPVETAPASILPTTTPTPLPEAKPKIAEAAAEGKMTMNDVIESTKQYTEEAKTRFQSAFSDMNAKAKVGVEKSSKAMEEMGDIAKGNLEAMVESSKIAAKGIEAMGQDAAEYSRMSFEKATATMKSLAAVKSPTEFFQLQSEMISSAFDAFAKESAKNSEAMMKLVGEVAQPLSSRVSVVTDKVKSLAA